MLSTNDVYHNDTFNDNVFEQKEAMRKGFKKIMKELKGLDSSPAIYVLIPPPMITNDQSEWATKNWLPGVIREFAGQV